MSNDEAYEASQPEERYSEQMREAITRQLQQRTRSQHIDRTNWTRQQWIDDARALMEHIDGAITSLVNGHVMALLDEVADLRKGTRRPQRTCRVCGCTDDNACTTDDSGVSRCWWADLDEMNLRGGPLCSFCVKGTDAQYIDELPKAEGTIVFTTGTKP